jgi:hypothetical protein
VTLVHSIESQILVFRKEQQLVPSSRIVATGVKSIVTDGVIEVGRGYVPMHIRRNVKLDVNRKARRNAPRRFGSN